MIKKITATLFAFVALFGVGLFLYGWHLAVDIEQRFTARRWSVPSKVYSDTTVNGKTWEPQNFEPVTRYTIWPPSILP